VGVYQPPRPRVFRAAVHVRPTHSHAFGGPPVLQASDERRVEGQVLSYPNAEITHPGLVIVIPPPNGGAVAAANAVDAIWWKTAIVQGFAQAISFATFGVALYLLQRAQGKKSEFQMPTPVGTPLPR